MSSIKELIKKAQKEKYAIGAFNTSNLEVTQAIAQAAEAREAPAVISVTESALEYAGFNTLIKIIESVAAESKAPLVLHLDHGKSYAICKKCIDAGFESVMIDGSLLPFEKNIELTKSVVDCAHQKDVFVQAELGKIPRVSNGKKTIDVKIGEMEKTVPEEAEKFVALTGVDTLAVIIGNIHGMYAPQGNPHLDLELLKKIKSRVSVPFILHGGSGIPDEDIKKAVQEGGITTINIDTEIRAAFTNALEKFYAGGQRTNDPRKILSLARDATQKKVEEKIKLFGSNGKA